jgi:hypothetical protein
MTNFIENDLLSAEIQDSYSLLLSILSNEKILEKYQVHVRWHPHLTRAGEFERKRMAKVIESSPNVRHFLPEDDTNSYSLIDGSDTVVTTGSTIGIEAAYYGKASIHVGFALYEGLGSTYRARNLDELVSHLMNDLKPLSPEGAWLYGSFMSNFGSDYLHFQYQNGNYYSYKNPKIPFTRKSRFKIISRLLNKSPYRPLSRLVQALCTSSR